MKTLVTRTTTPFHWVIPARKQSQQDNEEAREAINDPNSPLPNPYERNGDGLLVRPQHERFTYITCAF
jgi:hypothetical protein